jgi:protein quaking
MEIVIGLELEFIEAEILRVSAVLENASQLLEHGSPLTTGGLFSNAGTADLNVWGSSFHSEVRLFLLTH